MLPVIHDGLEVLHEREAIKHVKLDPEAAHGLEGVAVNDALFEILSDWTDKAGLRDWGTSDKPVFYTLARGGTVKANRITPTDVSRTVAAAGAVAGLAPPSGPGRLGAHDLRRTCARNAYDNGATLLQVQKLLGHSDPKTTARYIGLGEEETETAADYIHY